MSAIEADGASALASRRWSSMWAVTRAGRSLRAGESRAGGAVLLAVAFTVANVWLMAPVLDIRTFGSDAVLYRGAAVAYLAGGDPWSLGTVSPYHFAGLPPTVLAFVPLALLPHWVTAISWPVASLLAADWCLRRIDLGREWLLFPPMVASIWFGNPQVVILALLLSPFAAVAPILKVYAVGPLVMRPRDFVLGGALGLATIGLAPGLWADYAANAGTIAGRLIVEAGVGWSAWGKPLLLGPALVFLGLLAWRRAWLAVTWLAVPLLWPAAELGYWTMALVPISAALRSRASAGDG